MSHLQSVIEYVKKKYPYEPEFCQTVKEVLTSVAPVVEAHPEYEKADLLTRMVEPERMFTFRVVWEDDNGVAHTNTGYRFQFNGAIGPYKGGLRFIRAYIRVSSSSLASNRPSKTLLPDSRLAAQRAAPTSTLPENPMRRLCVSARAI